MKATGIVRRIDNLGRIVIPKEIRKTLRIKEGEALEIFTDREGEVILKKYSPIEELSSYAIQYAEALYQTIGHSVFITDTDQVIAASGMGKKEALRQGLTSGLEKLMQLREQKMLRKGEKDYVDVYQEMTISVESIILTPIIQEGNIIGSIVIAQKEGKETLGDVEKKLALVGANYLGSQMH
ncbi:MAG: stage V sporulation T C-terminal domain-containing protein [Eubacteriales bacterium]